MLTSLINLLHEYVQGFVTGGRRDRRVVPEAKLIQSPNQTILQFIEDPQRVGTHSSRYSRITVLSFNDRSGPMLLNRRPGTSPFGETSKSSFGFLYGSTSSTDQEPDW